MVSKKMHLNLVVRYCTKVVYMKRNYVDLLHVMNFDSMPMSRKISMLRLTSYVFNRNDSHTYKVVYTKFFRKQFLIQLYIFRLAKRKGKKVFFIQTVFSTINLHFCPRSINKRIQRMEQSLWSFLS